MPQIVGLENKIKELNNVYNKKHMLLWDGTARSFTSIRRKWDWVEWIEKRKRSGKEYGVFDADHYIEYVISLIDEEISEVKKECIMNIIVHTILVVSIPVTLAVITSPFLAFTN